MNAMLPNRATTGGGATGPANRLRAEGFDILRIRPFRILVMWAGFPYVFQAALLVVFVILIVLGSGVFIPAGVRAKLFAQSNVVTLLVWGVWWPLMVWIAVLLGRVWCAVCPLELVSNLGERLGRRLGWRQRVMARWLGSGALIVALYAVVQLFIASVQMHRTPAHTAWMLGGLLGLAFATALFFRDRAFCRGFCPVGLLLGTYGRGGMIAVRADGAATCGLCIERNCAIQRNRMRSDARSCPSLLQPATLASNRDCLVCGQCLKACSHANMRLLLRRPFSAADSREAIAGWPITVFVILLSGFVIWDVLTEWAEGLDAFLRAPRWLASQLEAGSMLSGALNWLWALFVVPIAIWFGLAGAMRLLGERDRVGVLLRRMAYPLAIVVAAGHMSKGLAKFVSWAPFLPGALDEADGITYAMAITAGTAAAPLPLLSLATVSMVGLALVGTSVFFALREQRLAQGSQVKLVAALPVVVMGITFATIIAQWP